VIAEPVQLRQSFRSHQKANAKSEAGDPLDRAAQAILGLLHRAAADAEASKL
jgi:hypothetical protein